MKMVEEWSWTTTKILTAVKGAAIGQPWHINEIKSIKRRWRSRSLCIYHRKWFLVKWIPQTIVMKTTPTLRIEFSHHLYPLASMITHLMDLMGLHLISVDELGVNKKRNRVAGNQSFCWALCNAMRKEHLVKSYRRMIKNLRRSIGLTIMCRAMILLAQLNNVWPSEINNRKIKDISGTPTRPWLLARMVSNLQCPSEHRSGFKGAIINNRVVQTIQPMDLSQTSSKGLRCKTTLMRNLAGVHLVVQVILKVTKLLIPRDSINKLYIKARKTKNKDSSIKSKIIVTRRINMWITIICKYRERGQPEFSLSPYNTTHYGPKYL